MDSLSVDLCHKCVNGRENVLNYSFREIKLLCTRIVVHCSVVGKWTQFGQKLMAVVPQEDAKTM